MRQGCVPSNVPNAPVGDTRETQRGGREKMDRLTRAFHDEHLFLPPSETNYWFLIHSLRIRHSSAKGRSGSVLSSAPSRVPGRREHDSARA